MLIEGFSSTNVLHFCGANEPEVGSLVVTRALERVTLAALRTYWSVTEVQNQNSSVRNSFRMISDVKLFTSELFESG